MRKVLIITSFTFAMVAFVNMLSSQEEQMLDENVPNGERLGQLHNVRPESKINRGPGIGPHVMMKNAGMRKGDVGRELEEKVMKIISQNDPTFASKINELRKKDQIKYRQIIKMSINLLELADDDKIIEKDIVKGISLEFETRELAKKFMDATSSEKEKIKLDIKAKLNELFDIRTKVQELKVKKLEAKMKELKTDLEKRKQNKSKIVESRLNELLEDRALKW